MSAVYVLFVCENVTHYEDPNSTAGYAESPKPEIYGIYSSKKRAKKNIEKALAEKHVEVSTWFLRKGQFKELEWSPKSRYKGFEFETLERSLDRNTFELTMVKRRISYHCYIERFVVD